MSEPITTVRHAAGDIFPLDKRLGLSASSLSPALAREAVWLSGLVAYEQVRAVMARLGGYSVPSTTVWETVQREGERMLQACTAHTQRVSVERTAWNQQQYDPALRKGVSMDGGMVNVRGEGWKELKVGVVSTLQAPQQQHEGATEPISTQQQYTAVVGSVEDFARVLWALAVSQLVPYAGLVAVTADGAAWIWRLVADLFPCSTQIVDWYHAAQHLAEAALARTPNDPHAAQQWTLALKQLLFDGECWKVIALLHQAGLADHAAYFEEHLYRMHYPAFRADGLPIGSGTTESAVKQYKQRLCGPGMRWSRPGLNRMVVIRSAVLNHAFDTQWRAV